MNVTNTRNAIIENFVQCHPAGGSNRLPRKGDSAFRRAQLLLKAVLRARLGAGQMSAKHFYAGSDNG